MALRPRWRKMLRDIWHSKARTALVVMSITLGVVGVGMLGQTQVVLFSGMADSLTRANRAAATLITDPFDGSMVDTVRRQPGVEVVEGRTLLDVRLAPDLGEREPTSEQWRSMQILALDDFDGMRMDKLVPAQGAWPPAEGDIVVEQTALDYAGLTVGDNVWIELPDGHKERLAITGAVRDAGRIPASLSGVVVGYVRSETLETLEVPKLYNMLAFQPEGSLTDADNIQRVAGIIRDEFSDHSVAVHATLMPEPGKHWAYDIVDSMNYILQSLGLLVLVLGSSLIVNTMLATLSGQLRQIGVMQVIGATPGDLLRMYIGSVLVYSVLALAIGIPLGQIGSEAITVHSIDIMNFDSSSYGASSSVLMVQAVVGLIIPLLAALPPLLHGARITASEAIAGESQAPSRSFIDILLERIARLPRPLLLSLRNTFRKKARLFLTLVTLSVGGAIVISVISVYESMQLSLANSLRYVNYDVRVALTEPQPKAELERLAAGVDGVVRAETWGQRVANRVRPEGGESRDLTLQGIPVGSDFIRPTLEKGRWLEPGDRNALVVNTDLLRFEKDLDIGSEVRLKIGGEESVWTVVGLARRLVGEVTIYVPEAALAEVTGAGPNALLLNVATDDHDRMAQARIAAELQSRLKDGGYQPASSVLTEELREVQQNKFNVVLAFLAVLAVLLTLVAALGLMGTLSLSVLERTREIGVMRTIGAGDRAIFGIVIGEALFIGFLSWLIGSLLALPISKQLSDGIGQSIFFAPLDYRFSVVSVVLWLGGALLIAAAAGFMPAWNASRLAVRDVLAYE
ncbi:ABC transporter permease [Paenibacillus sp. GD4]|uniref:ABC transporter permease n=1 Tax=Paenibacillus sp. GD4 TaxID=3068890 RepID=UPI0027969948|nr:ABC transporter permease [Paenibacillus sp. GD4]MDQ1911118.1 ABC transporter permease [Paenibacillus sp. GD4]